MFSIFVITKRGPLLSVEQYALTGGGIKIPPILVPPKKLNQLSALTGSCILFTYFPSNFLKTNLKQKWKNIFYSKLPSSSSDNSISSSLLLTASISFAAGCCSSVNLLFFFGFLLDIVNSYALRFPFTCFDTNYYF